MIALRTRRQRVLAGLCTILIVAAVYIRVGPLPPEAIETAVESTVVVDRTGAPLYESLSHDGTRAIAIAADALPPLVVAAAVAAEDRRYWWHPGVDPLAMLRAVRVNLMERRVVEGGSTLSQQVAKLLRSRAAPGRHRGLAAKIHEAVVALRLEHRYSKREILALYFNHAAYGNQIVGIERASRAYFGVSPDMLTVAQAAFLAGLPQRPTRFNPYRNLDLAISRQRAVLARMAAAGAISADDHATARAEKLAFNALARPFDAPHLVEMVLADVGAARPARIETTLDRVLQRQVGGIIDSYRDHLLRHGARNVAVVVLDNASGEWLAWEGSGSYHDEDHGGRLNGPVVPRQPGSALKPFTYAAAFEQGFTPASILNDAPTYFATADPAVSYKPQNYDGQYRGALRARDALGGSQNVPAVVLASHIGVPTLLRTLARAGLTTLDKNAAHYGLGITLGNAEVRLDELVAAYAAFARGGIWIEPSYRRGDVTGAPGGRGARSERRLFSLRTAFWITDILSDAGAREAVFGRGGDLEFPFPVAVKTGTSQAYHDNWTIGYSRHVTVGVWVGNFNRTPLRNSSGVTGAAPIFHAVMMAAQERVAGGIDERAGDIVPRPADVIGVEICASTGKRATARCPIRQREWLPVEAPADVCHAHVHAAEAVAASTGSDVLRLAIQNPPDGSTYLIDPTLRREFQALPLRAVTPRAGAIEWFVNGVPSGVAAAGSVVEWPLSRGRHTITARDASGRTAQATIVVR